MAADILVLIALLLLVLGTFSKDCRFIQFFHLGKKKGLFTHF